MVEEAPDKYVATITKAKRKGKILIDYFRNDYTATAIAGYSLRARQGAPVAVPLEWRELSRLHRADQFDMKAVLKRLQAKALREALPKQRLPKSAAERIHKHGRNKTSAPDGSAARRAAA